MAKLKDILEEHDFSLLIETTASLGPSLSKIEIEGVLADNGIPSLDRNIRFKILDVSERLFLVVYIHGLDEFYYERLTVAT